MQFNRESVTKNLAYFDNKVKHLEKNGGDRKQIVDALRMKRKYKYALKVMGSNDTVNIPDSVIDKIY